MEQLKRFELLVGSKNIEKISNTKVLVLGLGGVGSYALEAIVRSGVGSVVIVDYDKIDITNLNRQLMTNHNNIGRLKTEVWKERIKDINPNCNVEVVTKKLTKEDVNELFKYQINYVIDACDTLEVKKELILACHKNKVKLISSMGTGNKLNPSMLMIDDVRKTSYDPIARRIRKYLKDHHISGNVPVVYSKEKGNKFEGSVPSMMFVPAVAGLLCANFVIKDIINTCKK